MHNLVIQFSHFINIIGFLPKSTMDSQRIYLKKKTYKVNYDGTNVYDNWQKLNASDYYEVIY